MAVKKVLIVEDEKPLARALDLKLKSSGFETTVAYNGEEALSVLKDKTYDLMLIDIMMPKRDGFSVLEELKKQGNKTPAFVMSNLSQEEDIKHAKSDGVKEYIVKSDTPLAEIVAKVNAFLHTPKHE
jgi:DNA-binding response OmpR family regulator